MKLFVFSQVPAAVELAALSLVSMGGMKPAQACWITQRLSAAPIRQVLINMSWHKPTRHIRRLFDLIGHDARWTIANRGNGAFSESAGDAAFKR